MLKVVITGGVGSGKSTVARMFNELGAKILDADQVAREVVAPGEPAWEELQRAFGPDYFQKDGTLNRAKVASWVFQDPQVREVLNALVHPWLTRELQRRLKELEQNGEPLVLVDHPLVFEMGQQDFYNYIILVYADRPTQVGRLRRRDKRPAEEINGILEAQWPMEEKATRAHFVVDNRGDLADTRRQVEAVWEKLKNALDFEGQKG